MLVAMVPAWLGRMNAILVEEVHKRLGAIGLVAGIASNSHTGNVGHGHGDRDKQVCEDKASVNERQCVLRWAAVGSDERSNQGGKMVESGKKKRVRERRRRNVAT